MRKIIYVVSFFSIASAILFSCTKDKGIDPNLVFSDDALFDSCKNAAAYVYYKNDPDFVYSGTAGPHGTFKLKFNKIANAALTDNGKLPVGGTFPEGSMVVKEIVSGGQLGLYAFMYKRSSGWLWGEVEPDGKILWSVSKDPTLCISCHQQPGNRDLVDSFNFY